MSFLQLGAITFQGFELPSRLRFGGAQQLAIHKLIGGTRVVDALGRDDAPLVWSGILSGGDAARRARSLDDVRVAGQAQTLTWDAFCYSVIVAKLSLDFSSPWWIPYEISCTVQRDLAQNTPIGPPSVLAGIMADLSSAQQLLSPGLAVQVASASTLLASSTEGASCAAVISSTRLDIDRSIQTAQLGLDSSVIDDVVNQAGLLAQLCCARGFLDRSVNNLGAVGI